jgi:hypothetical protein
MSRCGGFVMACLLMVFACVCFVPVATCICLYAVTTGAIRGLMEGLSESSVMIIQVAEGLCREEQP